MTVNVTTAPNVRPGVLFRALLTTSDANVYVPAGFGAQIARCNFVNQTASDVKVTMSVIKSGGLVSDGICYLYEETIKAKGSVGGNRLILDEIHLDDGDFISMKADTNLAVAVTGTGWEYGASGIILSGIQDDAVGDPGYAASAVQVDAKCDVANGPNRLLAALMVVTHSSGAASSSTYDTLSMDCGSGATSMGPPKVSADFSVGGTIDGSAHLFALSGPAASTRHTVRGKASKAGFTMDLTVIPMSFTGVLSVAGFALDNPTSSAAVNLPITTAVGERVLWGGGFDIAPQGLRVVDGGSVGRGRIRGFEGSPTIGFVTPHWAALIDAVGIAGALTLISRVATYHAVVGMRLLPA